MFGLQITVGSVVFYPVALRLTIQASKEKVNQQTQSYERAESQQQNSPVYQQSPNRNSNRDLKILW